MVELSFKSTRFVCFVGIEVIALSAALTRRMILLIRSCAIIVGKLGIHYLTVLDLFKMGFVKVRILRWPNGCTQLYMGWTRLWLESDSTYVVHLFCTKSLFVPWPVRQEWLRCLELRVAWHGGTLSQFFVLLPSFLTQGRVVEWIHKLSYRRGDTRCH
ncbi:uncharacterized protein [Euphorbia lathyris]|uniref:uncharacterized protein n=1 Tax=Euphorbia lathyris TaxID=212925 RepID=UPI0033133EAC